MSAQEGALLWVPQSEFTWRPATILRISSERKSAIVRWLDSNEQEAVDLTTLCDKNSSLFDCGYGCIPQIDLSGLDFINEPEVLHNLRTRFCDQHEIYTYCGLLLIVLNPYEDLPIYGMEFMNAYNQNDVESETRRDPHIFAIADEALSRMKLLQQNQSIIISGESGAGKTVSARHVLKYLTAMTTTRRYRGLSLKKDTVSTPIRVLASSPLLESLGNARTTHNDNSSRFGKFLEVAFSQVGYRLVRACIKTYLLEKSRVVLQDKNERNYHIFYQLLAAVSDPRLKSSHSFLNGMALDRSTTYHYAKWEEIESGDLENFTTTLQSLQDLGFSDDEVNTVFTILAAILHLGNVTYSGISQGGSQITDAGERSLKEAFQLLQCTVQSNSGGPAYDCICFRIIHTVEGEMHKPLTVPEANSARDALAKLIYQMLFRWIVKRCNESLAACSEEPTEDNFIGILDIYGFETMEVNSFEQFCINYANEKLQQRFIKNVFQLEQEEYIREGLEWSFVEYYNNAPCIQLLEGPMGVIELLNDECKLPRPNDRNWLGRICNEHLGRSRDFSQSKFWAQERFIIQHFSEKVEYAVDGFVEKNLDRIIPEHANLLTSTKSLVGNSTGFPISRLRISEKEKSQNMDFIPYMLHINPVLRKMIENFGKTNVIGVKHQGIFTKPTVVTQFSTSLGTLMEILNRTTSHYVRCIKPNDHKAPFTFCPERVMRQLRACGVIQTIRISAAGYPSRWTYEDFLSRYWQLCPGNHCFEKDPVKKSEAILRNNVEDANKYRLGRTKIFFGNGVLAYLERARSARITAATTVIQSHLRGWITRRCYQPILQQITAIQAFARRWLAQEHLRQLQEIRRKQQQKTEASEDTKFAREKGSSKTYNRALSLLRRHKTPRHTKTEVEESKGKSIEMLEREINSLRNQLKIRESEIAVKESQIAKLMKKEEQVEESKKGKRGRLNNHSKHKGSRGQSDRSFGDYEEVNYHSGGKPHRSLRKITPVGVELKIASEDATFKSGRKTEMNQWANASANLLLDLQARCSTLDAEKEELYRKLEMYQEALATAQARQHEAQMSICRLEEWIEHLTKNASATGSCLSEAQTDVKDLANLESMIQIHREASRRLQKEVELLNAKKSQLEWTLTKQNEELHLLRECNVYPPKKDVSKQDDLEDRVSRLAKENLILREQLSTANTLTRQLTSTTKYFAELVRRRAPDCLQMTTTPYLLDVRQLIAVAQSRADANGIHNFTAKSSLLRCLEGKEVIFINRLVKDLDVQKAKSWPSLAVAELIFLLLRGADAVHDEAQISTLLTTTIRAVQSVLNEQTSTNETILFWLVNTFGLRNCIYKFSGNGRESVCDEERIYELQNYDINPFLPLLNDVITLAFQLIMGQVAEVVFPQALITGALLEYEPIPSLTCQALIVSASGGLRPQNTWLRRKPHFKRFMNSLDNIFDFLTALNADASLTWCILHRIFYYICSSALNSILLRKDLCNWARGAQIRHNLATLETWLSDRDLVPEESDSEVYRRGRHLRDLVLPLIQVCHILQSKKGGSDKVKISSLCQLCPNLTSAQILRLLSRCTLVNGMEEVVQPEFLAAVRRRLREQRPQENCKTTCCGVEVSQTTLLLDSDYWDASNEVIPFAPLPNSLGDFQMPVELEDLAEFLVAVDL
ncbi:myosin va [Echinococcus multilocularis]|uniref:Myosin va n=1 Tax=Echinococcus multilocularis TaxID=6211 RepID=A0A068Y9K6_ECHMU|nr:myosin va [Echinococcus multilocularis]